MTPSSPAIATDSRRDYPLRDGFVDSSAAPASAVSWGAIFAGAAAAAALSLILLILGTGLGLSALSPWAQEGASAKSLGVSTILWVTFMQLAASAMGGYIAGRLRTKWVDIQTDEIAFRDTAHGFLAWGVATLATAALLTSTITSIVSGGIQAGASVAGGAASTAAAAAAGGAAAAGTDSAKSGADGGPMRYFVDSLFRKDAKGSARAGGSGASSEQDSTAEVTRIFTNAISTGKLPPEDSRYVSQVVAQRTGLSQQEAEKRVNDTFARMQAKLRDTEAAAREAADKARKASALAALWLFISLLLGAFVASLCATYGGRRRDALD
jgi:hypothetical protein